jgi:hypothetical protein
MAISQLPVIWVFSARNDPLLWLTGWSFATYNRFHRWVARICLLLAFTHATCFSIYTWKSGMGLVDYYTASWELLYFYCGAIVSFDTSRDQIFMWNWLLMMKQGVVMISTMVATSVLRIKWYDLFLMVHTALAIVLIVVLWL